MLKLDDILKCQWHYFSLFSKSSFAVNDYLDATRHSGYQRFAVLLGDFTDPNFLDCLPQLLFDLMGVSLWLQHISYQNAYPMAAQCACGEVQTAVWCIRLKTSLSATQ